MGRRQGVSIIIGIREPRIAQIFNTDWGAGKYNPAREIFAVLGTEKFLNEEVVKSNLLLASLYLAAYEILKHTIMYRVKRVYAIEYTADAEPVVDKGYNEEVLSLHKYPLSASSLWLESAGAISSEDVEMIDGLRRHRNEIAHELPEFLTDPERDLYLGYYVRMRNLLNQIEVWWIMNFEIPANPDFDDVEVEEKEVSPGTVILLDYLTEIALAHRREDKSSVD